MRKRRFPPTRLCLCCGSKYEVNPRVGLRHRYCSRAECRREAKRASQKRWLNKPENAGYFKGASNALRARLWRAANPRKKKRRQKTVLQLMTPQLKAALKACGVQDLNEGSVALVLGAVSLLARSRVQETIARRIRQLMFAGYAVLRSEDPLRKSPRLRRR